LVDAAGIAFTGELECKTHFRDGHYVSIAPTKAERAKIFGENDNVWPRIVISAGYDGRAFKASLGYYRDACKNLAIMRTVSETTVSIRHTSGLRKHMRSLIDAFETLKNGWGSLTETIAQLESTPVNVVDFLDQIYGRPTQEQLALVATGQSVRAVTIHENRTRTILNRLNSERARTNRPLMVETISAWEAYNAIQGYVQHEAQSRKTFGSEFDRILRASRDSDVLNAERYVMSLVA
jgi:hypothetical protein